MSRTSTTKKSASVDFPGSWMMIQRPRSRRHLFILYLPHDGSSSSPVTYPTLIVCLHPSLLAGAAACRPALPLSSPTAMTIPLKPPDLQQLCDPRTPRRASVMFLTRRLRHPLVHGSASPWPMLVAVIRSSCRPCLRPRAK